MSLVEDDNLLDAFTGLMVAPPGDPQMTVGQYRNELKAGVRSYLSEDAKARFLNESGDTEHNRVMIDVLERIFAPAMPFLTRVLEDDIVTDNQQDNERALSEFILMKMTFDDTRDFESVSGDDSFPTNEKVKNFSKSRGLRQLLLHEMAILLRNAVDRTNALPDKTQLKDYLLENDVENQLPTAWSVLRKLDHQTDDVVMDLQVSKHVLTFIQSMIVGEHDNKVETYIRLNIATIVNILRRRSLIIYRRVVSAREDDKSMKEKYKP